MVFQLTVADPGRLRLDALAGQGRAVGQDQPLLLGDPRHDVAGHADAVGGAEHLDPPATVGWLRVAQPLHAFAVIAEGRGVFQRVGEVEPR